MLPRLGRDRAAILTRQSRTLSPMVMGSADVFRKRQVISDLNNVVQLGRDAILRFSVRAHVDAFPKVQANGGRFTLPEDKDFYSDVLLAAAMPEDDFPAFTTATAILLIDLLKSGEGTDKLYWNWEAFERHYRMADPHIRAAIMNAFRVGFDAGTVDPDSAPGSQDCLTFSRNAVLEALKADAVGDLVNAIESDISAENAGTLWKNLAASASPIQLIGFRYLYERQKSMTPQPAETAPLIPWS